ncbi:MAG: bifunctional enoyl-CoA hydratase/phosphate acetyltransferase [Armatimonadota bacterium]
MLKDLNQLVEKAKQDRPKKIVLVKAEDKNALPALKAACDEGIVEAILVGNKTIIESSLKDLDFKKGIKDIFDFDDPYKASAESVKLINSGEGDALLKGLLHTDILLSAILNKECGLRTGKLLSHVVVAEIKRYHKLLLITDVAMNIAPDLDQKKQIVQNAIDLAAKLGIDDIKVACLAAVEDVNSKMQCTLDAACLAKMSDRGQIKGGKVDGPLAFDNAISKKAVEIKGIKSSVAGDADILLVPQIESGNILFKALDYFGEETKMAGIIVGAKCPVALLSRADSAENKFYSLVLAALNAN